MRTIRIMAFLGMYFITLIALADGGIGSVWIDNITATSFRVHWDYSTNDYEVRGSPKFKICYKNNGSWEGACDDKYQYSNDNYADVTYHVYPLQTYKIKVIGQSVKRFGGGTMDRKIGTNEVTTIDVAPPPPDDGGYLWIKSVTETSLTTAWSMNDPFAHGYIFIRYKKAGSLGLHRWYGTYIQSTYPNSYFEFSGLAECRKYWFELYWFDFPSTYIFVNGCHGKTECSGICDPNQQLFDHFPDLFQQYMVSIDSLYGCTNPNAFNCNLFFDHIAQIYPQITNDRDTLLADHEPDISYTPALMDFLLFSNDTIWQAWQAEPSLVAANLDLQSFTQARYPGVWEMVQDDCNIANAAIPTLTQWGLIILGLLLLSFGIFYIYKYY